MPRLKDDLARDMSSTFLNADEFARAIIYQPGGVVANQRTIQAIVDWGDDVDGPTFLGEDGSRSEIRIDVANDAVLGVDNPDVTRDAFLVAADLERQEVRYKIKRIVGRDEGAWSLLLRIASL